MRKFVVIVVPGLRDEMPDHWQSHLQREISGAVCVPRRAEEKLSCERWVEALQETVQPLRGELILVGHSAGCHIVAHWARRTRRRVRGALLATPTDIGRPLPAGYPQPEALRANGWMPVQEAKLPFPSIVAASSNDPLCSPEAALTLAQQWGSRLVDVGAVGHLNPAAGYGPWPRAVEFIEDLMKATGHAEVQGATERII